MTTPIISVENLSKSFHVGGVDVPILKKVSLDVTPGDFLIIFGPSGCGKSTLLHTILGLEPPNQGTILFLGNNLYERVHRTMVVEPSTLRKFVKTTNIIDEDERSEIRKKHIGMVYQQANWIKALTVAENIAFPLQLLGHTKTESIAKALEMLGTMDMTAWANYIPTELSSGQQQKIALIRALVTDPEVIIADEPTGNLDYESGQELMQILTKMNTVYHKTILMVTHDLEYLKFAKTAVKMFNGEIVGVYKDGEKGALESEVKGKRGHA
ncbi:MAG: ABC transporter ATP-binding protein [Candidatus Microgenomates bacterium]|jgi:putative ABC transport system ATP-binding protein